LLATPGVTLNELVSDVSPDADAVIVTAPAVAPVTVFDAMPALAVAVPSPVTEPVPDVLANVTTVELSEVTRWLPESRISTVSVFVAPEAIAVVDDVNASFAAADAAGVSAKSRVVVPPELTATPLALPSA
jgi:hypothetical protein